ncbi:MAG: hypothetical protein Pg6C_17860 [Treponemataceae bacterium]|nr:MAG: hypothetical protein Pg6C_17860 [Treponemataceae bacterium]
MNERTTRFLCICWAITTVCQIATIILVILK